MGTVERTSTGSDALPPRVHTTSEESSPGEGETGGGSAKNPPLHRPASKRPRKRSARNEDEVPDHDHAPLASGLRKDDDEDPDGSELDGMDSLLRLDGDAGNRASKKPATRNASTTQKKPAGRKKVGFSKKVITKSCHGM